MIALVAGTVVLALMILSVAWFAQRRHSGNAALPAEEEQAGPSVPAPRPSPAGPAVEEEAARSLTQASTTADTPVSVKTTPEGADIVFDNNPRLACKSPCSMALASGRHSASATLEGYRSAMRIFRLPEENEFSMHLARMTGEVLILSEPAGAAILIDGTRRRETTPATLQVAAGKHTISVAKEGYPRTSRRSRSRTAPSYG